MTDQSKVRSLLTSVTSWITTVTVTVTLTPATLFLLLNLVIGTIAVTARFTSKDKPQHQLGSNDSHGQRQIARVPSLLDRVKSFQFSLHKFPNHEHEHEHEPTVPVEPELPQRLARRPSLLERLKSIRPTSVYVSQESETETEVIGIEGAETNTVHRPTRSESETKKQKSMTEEETEMTVGDGDDDVDAKADDFINKFKRQLRLQRLDSLLRYKEMLIGK